MQSPNTGTQDLSRARSSLNPLRKSADLLALGVIEHGGIRGIVVPDIEGKSAIKARFTSARPYPQDIIWLEGSSKRAGLVPGFRDQPPASQVYRCIRAILDIHIFPWLVDRNDEHSAAACRDHGRLRSARRRLHRSERGERC